MQLMRRSYSNICPGLNLNTMMLLFMSFFACKRLELRCLNLGKIVDTLTNDRHSTYTSDSIQQISKIVRLQVEKTSQPAKLDLNKNSLPKQKTIQTFTIDFQGFKK